MAVTALHTFGWRMEQELQPKLESFLEQKLTKTVRRFDTIDFVTPTHAVELKARQGVDKYGLPVFSTTYPDWLLPACKVSNKSDRVQVYFYYFEGDRSLWVLHKADVDWNTIKCQVPFWHTQLHYYVPANLWQRII